MKGIPQGRYTKEFRPETVKLVLEEGVSVTGAESGRKVADALDAELEINLRPKVHAAESKTTV